MSAVIDRLRLLQRQAGGGSDSPLSETLRSDLRRLSSRRERTLTRTLPAPAGLAVADGLYLVEQRWPACASATVKLPSLVSRKLRSGSLRSGACEPIEVERARLVCFDTETTGLAGGVGTKAFMIGMARWQRDELVVRQLYLTTLAGEAAMLRMFAEQLPSDPIFVSYNGRSYDTPLLKGRYRLHRQAHPFDDRHHVDLLYPVRRAFRGVWENCRLQTIERNLLGIVRDDDLPGSQAPAAWLSFLRGQSSVNLLRVLDHNRQDVVTLGRLFDRMAESTKVPDGRFAEIKRGRLGRDEIGAFCEGEASINAVNPPSVAIWL